MGRPPGATHNEKIRRQEKVFDLYVKGLHTTEISRQLGSGLRTIQRDIDDVKVWLEQNNDVHKLRTWARADAEYADLWREGQVLLHNPALHGDDPTLKLRIIDELRQIADSRNNLAFAVGRQKATEPNSDTVTNEEIVSAAINHLPPELRNKKIENIRKLVELEKGS